MYRSTKYVLHGLIFNSYFDALCTATKSLARHMKRFFKVYAMSYLYLVPPHCNVERVLSTVQYVSVWKYCLWCNF